MSEDGEVLILWVPPEPAEAENVRETHRKLLQLFYDQVYVPNADSRDDVDDTRKPIFPSADLKIKGFRVGVDDRCVSAERIFDIVKPLTKRISPWFTLVIPKKFADCPELVKFQKMHGSVKVEII